MSELEKIKELINKLFSDTSVPVEETKENLEELLEEVETLLDALS